MHISSLASEGQKMAINRVLYKSKGDRCLKCEKTVELRMERFGIHANVHPGAFFDFNHVEALLHEGIK